MTKKAFFVGFFCFFSLFSAFCFTQQKIIPDSSKIRKTQRVGRTIRAEEGKTAEFFTLLIKGTQEVNWFRNSVTTEYQVINEQQLEDILSGKIIETRQRENVENKEYRF